MGWWENKNKNNHNQPKIFCVKFQGKMPVRNKLVEGKFRCCNIQEGGLTFCQTRLTLVNMQMSSHCPHQQRTGFFKMIDWSFLSPSVELSIFNHCEGRIGNRMKILISSWQSIAFRVSPSIPMYSAWVPVPRLSLRYLNSHTGRWILLHFSP